jgi:PIN domain nuclease of toxin-antitoxin system
MLADPSNAVFVSDISLWEIVVKRRIGKMSIGFDKIVEQLAPESKIQRLTITLDHLDALDVLPFYPHHRDPFDHMMIAQAIGEDMTLVTADQHAPLYPVRIITP